MKYLIFMAAPCLVSVTLLAGMSGGAFAHEGHDPFDSVEPETTEGKIVESGEGPVVFSSIQNIEQSSSLEIWAGLRFKAYFHLTIIGMRDQNKQAIERTFTFEVANDTNDKIRANRGHLAKGAVITKAYARKLASCRELAERAMGNPAKYDFRVENRGRSGSVCRLINTQYKKASKTKIADRSSESAGDAA